MVCRTVYSTIYSALCAIHVCYLNASNAFLSFGSETYTLSSYGMFGQEYLAVRFQSETCPRYLDRCEKIRNETSKDSCNLYTRVVPRSVDFTLLERLTKTRHESCTTVLLLFSAVLRLDQPDSRANLAGALCTALHTIKEPRRTVFTQTGLQTNLRQGRDRLSDEIAQRERVNTPTTIRCQRHHITPDDFRD